MYGARYVSGRLAAFSVALVSAEIAGQIQEVAIGWYVFTLHHRVFDLGLVGLTLFLPTIVLALVVGLAADRFSRKAIVLLTIACEVLATGSFVVFANLHVDRLAPYLALILLLGIARAFAAPAERGMLLRLVPRDRYMHVSALFSSIRKVVQVGGPALGGALVAIGTPVALATAIVMLAVGGVAFALLPLPRRVPEAASSQTTWHDALGGLRFIRAQPIILGAISLDLFAVLFGGATALLPAFADTILHVGPFGLGLLRAAPSVGGFIIAVWLARRPPKNHVGRTLLLSIAVFGIGTILFGLSHALWFSLFALAILGGADMISVAIRSGLVQLNTPDAMRGRVSAVENVFIGASNELGAFESGTLAALLGTVPSVVFGGSATLLVVALWTVVFPRLAKMDALHEA